MTTTKIARQHPTKDGDGVNISRIAAFHDLALDPFLMIDEIRSDEASDYIGGFPAHPHRGIETFTYIKKGGFEHRDQMGNVKAIRAGDVQWMSTGRGVIHSEMPLADANEGMHGFQIWLNMPAAEKMRAPRYFDSTNDALPSHRVGHSRGIALAGEWYIDKTLLTSALQNLAGEGAIVDTEIAPNENLTISWNAKSTSRTVIFCYSGGLTNPNLDQGDLAKFHSNPDQTNQSVTLTAGKDGAQVMLLRGTPINEKIVHMGPFVMNTQAEIEQAIRDYRAGYFGSI